MDENENIVYLIKKRKTGLMKIIFSRFLIVAILILIQVSMILSVYGWFKNYFPHFMVFQSIFSVLMVIYLFNCGMDYSAKLTWLFIIMLFPVPGTIFLCYTMVNIGHRAIKKRAAELISQTKDKLKQDDNVLNDSSLAESGTIDLCRYLNKSGCFPIYKNTDVTYFPLGEYKFEAMISELKKAEKFIFMEYFIIDEGYMWGKILGILAEKVRQGVEVRVMYDGMCEAITLTNDYPKRMEKLGIKCRAFSPITPFISTHYNYRDHRKILVIDGKTAFNGGVNLADEYINKAEYYGHWKDTAVMLKGKAAESFTLMFLQMWNISEKEPEWNKYLDTAVDEGISDNYVMPFCDCPLDEYKVGESVYMDILNRASHYVHIMTPYLILDNELETSLKFAAQRGIDVKLILPGIPDKKTAYALAKSHYKALIDAGVEIYEYTPGFVHAKVFVSDDIKSVVGTINLDYRSLYHHFECATYIYGKSCACDIEADFQDTLKKCGKVTHDTIKNEEMYYKVMGSIMKIIAPLM